MPTFLGIYSKAPGDWRSPKPGGSIEAVLDRAIAIIALGANQGAAQRNVLRAMERLQQISPAPLFKSSLWQTAPVDCPPDSPPFINAVVGQAVNQGETPESLLQKLQQIEKEFGRRPKKLVNESRPLDLDLIAFGNETRSSADLVLPHPRAHLRRFVLEPLNEIFPNLILPGQTKPVRELVEPLRVVAVDVRRL